MIKKGFNKLKSLSLLEWQILVTSVILLPLVALTLHLFGFKRTQQFMKSFSFSPKSFQQEDQKLQDGQTIARMISIAATHSVYKANCLKKSLMLWWLLRRRGISADLRIGVQKENGRLNAHAWVEINGMVLIDDVNTIQGFFTLI